MRQRPPIDDKFEHEVRKAAGLVSDMKTRGRKANGNGNGNGHAPPISATLLKLADAVDFGWKAELILTDTGKPAALLANVLTALRKAPEWIGVLRYDEFAYRVVLATPPPWAVPHGWKPRAWTDDDDCRATEWMQRAGIKVRLSEVGPAVVSVARDNSFHPVREYLNGLHWDCESRLDDELPRLFGVKASAYVSAVFRHTLIAAVARIMEPGCKVDTVLMLEGDQGKRKSSAFETLFGKQWFTDDLAELGTKDSSMSMAGVWGIEIADLASMKKADIDKVKAFITRKIDRFRPPYGKHLIEAPRASIMCATTNLDDWSKDETGGRRFWPVLCETDIDIEGIGKARDQLWAEAVALYRAGEPWWMTDKVIIEQARAQVAGRSPGDPWDKKVREHVHAKNETTIEEILDHAIFMDKSKQDRGHQMRVSSILKRMGWRKKRTRHGGQRVSSYVSTAYVEDDNE